MTVAELIAALDHWDRDAQVVIVDADTGWIIDKIHIADGKDCNVFCHEAVPGEVCLWGDYPEMRKAK